MSRNDIIDDWHFDSRKEKYALFRKSKHAEGIHQITALLKKADIPFIVNDSTVDSDFQMDTLHNEIELKIQPSDFSRANTLIKNSIKISLDEFDPDYYLFEFKNDELYDILIKPDEWGDIDYKLAQLILNDRGVNVDDDLLQSLRQQRNKDLSITETAPTPYIYTGYLFALVGGFFGLFFGWYLMTAKKTLPDGNRIYVFDKNARKHGKIILIIAIIIFPLSVYSRVLSVR